MRRAPRSLLALVLGLAFGVTACTAGDSRPTLADERTPASAFDATGAAQPRGDYIVEASVPMLEVYDEPGAAAPSREFESPWYYETDVERRFPIQSVFFSDEQRDGWVRIMLPVRPNGSTGWVKTSDVRLIPSRFRVEIDVSDHRLTVYEGDRVFLEDTVAVGKADTPTPLGKFYLRVLLEAPDPNTVYGPYAYGLSSYSETLEEFNGADAQTGIHGNDDASQLGEDASAGCIRMDNEKITRLAGILPLGTPVEVRA